MDYSAIVDLYAWNNSGDFDKWANIGEDFNMHWDI